jgi:hypothetical protein
MQLAKCSSAHFCKDTSHSMESALVWAVSEGKASTEGAKECRVICRGLKHIFERDSIVKETTAEF